jgi:hypothetical protein
MSELESEFDSDSEFEFEEDADSDVLIPFDEARLDEEIDDDDEADS